MIYKIKSYGYLDQYLEGPGNADLDALEDEWAETIPGSVLDFIEWLLTKGFKRLETVDYKFNRG